MTSQNKQAGKRLVPRKHNTQSEIYWWFSQKMVLH